ncbi:MAG: type II toxin-antitoxin system RelE/ParE family toxin [Bacteroidota bacterium]
MSYKVVLTDKFKKQAKKLLKKYRSLKNELEDFETSLLSNPVQGTALGNNSYKIRLGVKSKGKGKSGGVRIITFIVTDDSEIYLLTIYDKSEIENVDDKTLEKLISTIKK